MGLLCRVVDSMAHVAKAAGVRVVTGDTKVVERGHGDGLYINTSGVGILRPGNRQKDHEGHMAQKNSVDGGRTTKDSLLKTVHEGISPIQGTFVKPGKGTSAERRRGVGGFSGGLCAGW